MSIHELARPIIIAGPCAAESENQVRESAREAEKRNITVVRLSLWKPRTEPGSFDGVKEQGIPWLIEVAQAGLVPATEVMSVDQAQKVIDGVIGHSPQNILIWLGARNQNQQFQEDIGRLVAGEPRVKVMIKNPPWADPRHWEGIVKYLLSGGADPDQLILCHRGFYPRFTPENGGLRNLPDFPMAMRLKRETGLPMIIDPSHIGGSVKNVIRVAKQATRYQENGVGFDGLIVEVHPQPSSAQSDSRQQLTWEQFDGLLEDLKGLMGATKQAA